MAPSLTRTVEARSPRTPSSVVVMLVVLGASALEGLTDCKLLTGTLGD